MVVKFEGQTFGESEGGVSLPRGLELEAFIYVLGNRRSVAGFEQVHISHCGFGRLAAAADVVLGGHALKVDVPAVELALSHDEVGSERSLALLRGGSDGRSSLDGGSCGFFAGAKRLSG